MPNAVVRAFDTGRLEPGAALDGRPRLHGLVRPVTNSAEPANIQA